MLSGELVALVGEDCDGKRLRYFARVVLRCPGRRDLTRWFSSNVARPLEALLLGAEWIRDYIPKERKTPRPQKCGPMARAV